MATAHVIHTGRDTKKRVQKDEWKDRGESTAYATENDLMQNLWWQWQVQSACWKEKIVVF